MEPNNTTQAQQPQQAIINKDVIIIEVEKGQINSNASKLQALCATAFPLQNKWPTREEITLLLSTDQNKRENFLKEFFMSGKSATVGGIKINQSKLFDMAEKPAEFEQVLNQAAALVTLFQSLVKADRKSIFRARSVDGCCNYFYEYDGAGNFNPRQKVLSEVETLHTTFANTENQKLFLNLAKALADILNASGLFKQYQEYSSIISSKNETNLKKVMQCIEPDKTGKISIIPNKIETIDNW